MARMFGLSHLWSPRSDSILIPSLYAQWFYSVPLSRPHNGIAGDALKRNFGPCIPILAAVGLALHQALTIEVLEHHH